MSIVDLTSSPEHDNFINDIETSVILLTSSSEDDSNLSEEELLVDKDLIATTLVHLGEEMQELENAPEMPNEAPEMPNEAPEMPNEAPEIPNEAPEIPNEAPVEPPEQRHICKLWVLCKSCSGWRYLPNIQERSELPQEWHCHMNPDPANAKCGDAAKSIPLKAGEYLIDSLYSAGSLVWGRLGSRSWPAIVEDNPLTKTFFMLEAQSDIPACYYISYLGTKAVKKAWLAPANIKPFDQKPVRGRRLSETLRAAIKMATEASRLPLLERMAKYRR